MPAEFSQIGTYPTAPAQFIGRDEDLGRLEKLLTKTEKLKPGIVRLSGRRLKEARGLLGYTLDDVAHKAGLSWEVVRKAERGEPIRLDTASPLATTLGKSVDELTAPAGESIAIQTVVVVHGLPGVGKTTIAARLAHDPDLRNAFEGCLWVSLGESPDPLMEMIAWGRALGLDLDQEKDAKHARARLTAHLSRKRMLIIIDDAWMPEPAFDLMVGGPRCATLVTTRLPDLANAIAPTEDDIYHLDVLTEGDAVALLRALARSIVEEHDAEAKVLANELEFLPLALQVAGRTLREERQKASGALEIRQLLKFLQDPANLLEKNAPGGPKVWALLKKSIDILEPRAQLCFAFLAPFAQKPAHFDQKALNALWKGITDDPVQMRDLFISRGLLEPLNVNGKQRFWLHSLLVAYAKVLNIARVSK